MVTAATDEERACPAFLSALRGLVVLLFVSNVVLAIYVTTTYNPTHWRTDPAVVGGFITIARGVAPLAAHNPDEEVPVPVPVPATKTETQRGIRESKQDASSSSRQGGGSTERLSSSSSSSSSSSGSSGSGSSSSSSSSSLRSVSTATVRTPTNRAVNPMSTSKPTLIPYSANANTSLVEICEEDLRLGRVSSLKECAIQHRLPWAHHQKCHDPTPEQLRTADASLLLSSPCMSTIFRVARRQLSTIGTRHDQSSRIPPVYVVHDKRAKKRLAAMVEQLRGARMRATLVTQFPTEQLRQAVKDEQNRKQQTTVSDCFYHPTQRDWRALGNPEWDKVSREDLIHPEGRLRILNSAEESLTLKHHLVLYDMVSRNVSAALVLEDDVAFDSSFPSNLSKLMGILPPDWDVVHLTVYRHFKMNLNAFIKPYIERGERVPTLMPTTRNSGTASYLVSHRAARLLLSYLPYRSAVDNDWNAIMKSCSYSKRGRINTFWATQSLTEHTDKRFRTLIQRGAPPPGKSEDYKES